MSLTERIDSRISKIRKQADGVPVRRMLYFHSQVNDVIDLALDDGSRLWALLKKLPGMEGAEAGAGAGSRAQALRSAGLMQNLYDFLADESNPPAPPCLFLTDLQVYENLGEAGMLLKRFCDDARFACSVLLISATAVLIPEGFADRIELIDALRIDQQDVERLLLARLRNEHILCAREEGDEALATLAHRFSGLTKKQIEDVLHLVAAECGVCCELSAPCAADVKLRDACRQATDRWIWEVGLHESLKDGTLTPVKTSGKVRAVGMDLYEEWLDQVKEAFIKDYPSAPRGVVFVGVPGTGKSLMAIRTAQAFECQLQNFNLNMIQTKYFGESQRNLRAKLDFFESRRVPLVVRIDEADKDLPQGSGENTHEVSSSLLGILLTWMNDRKSPIFLFFTANDISGMRDELLRSGRSNDVFFVGLPWRDELALILQSNLITLQREWQDKGFFFLDPALIKEMEAAREKGRAHPACTAIVDELAGLIKELDRDIFFTGSDIMQLAKDACNYLTRVSRKPMPFDQADLQSAMRTLAGRSRCCMSKKSIASIARLYLLCAEDHYSPVSSRTELIEAAGSSGVTLPPRSFACEYDRQLYQRIGGYIMEAKKQLYADAPV